MSADGPVDESASDAPGAASAEELNFVLRARREKLDALSRALAELTTGRSIALWRREGETP